MRGFLNQDKHQILLSFLLCVLIISSGGLLHLAGAVQEEWQIQVGDSQTYVYTEFYDVSLENPYKFSYWILDADNNNITITLKKGLTFRYDITFLSPDEARGKITFNGTITIPEQSISSRNYSGWTGLVKPSINNKTYWEEYCEYRGLENVTGDLIISEINTQDYKYINKWNWKTGWLEYYYVRNWNETTITSEYEYTIVPKESFSPLNVIVGAFILAVIVLILLGIKKFK